MAREITVSSNDKTIDINVTARSNITLETSRSVSYTGVQQVIAGDNISVTPSTGVGNVTIDVVGTVANATHAVTADSAGTVTTNAQPNITSLGTLTGLTSSANVTAPYFIGNVYGNIVGNIVVPGSQWDILYNNNGNAGASDNLKFDTTTLTVVGNVVANYYSGDGSLLSNINGGNVSEVANATYATTSGNSYSVDLANVVGIGNIASVNLDGNVGNLLTGDGTFIAIPTVTDNANYANYAGNLVVVGNENNVHVNLSNSQIDSVARVNNAYTQIYHNSFNWQVYPEDDTTGPNPAWAWVNLTLADINNPSVMIETTPADTGIPHTWTYDAQGNLTLPGNSSQQSSIIFDAEQNVFIQQGMGTLSIGVNTDSWLFGSDSNTAFPANGTANLGNFAIANKFYAGVGGDEYNGYGFTGVSNSNTAMCLTNTDEITIYNNANETISFYANNDTKIYGNLITNQILPSSNVTYDIGSDTQRYKDLYLSNASIYLGNVQVTATADAFIMPNANVTTDLVVGGNATIAGNLTVSGTTEYTNVNNLYIKDPLIEIGGAANNQPLSSNDGKDRGELLHYYTTQPVDAFMGWKSGNSEFQFASNVSNSDNVITVNTYGNIRAQHVYANINGSNVIGNVGNAVHAYNSDSANSVAGANVSGTVGNANVASYINGSLLSNLNVNGHTILGAPYGGAQLDLNLGVSLSAVRSLAGPTGGVQVNTGPSDTVTNTWTFGYNGNLTLPGNTFAVNYANGTQVDLNSPVANANYANYAGNAFSVTGSNVSGPVAYATTANSVAGANVSGSVSQSNYANIANSVAVANVSGIGNIATINLNGSTTQVLYGNGVFATLTIPSGTGISNGTSNVNIPISSGNVNTSVGAVANVFVVTTTGVNVAGTLNSTGNITGANASLGNLVTSNYFSGNGSLLTSITGANVSGAVAFATTANSVAGGNVSGSVSQSNYANIANSVAGSNVSGAVAFATTANSVAGANVSGQVGNALVAGTVYTAAQSNITSVGTLTGLNVSSAINATSFTSNVATGTAPFTVTSTTQVANLTAAFANVANTANAVAGANVSGTVSSATTAGTVTTAAQPNITSHGTLTGLTSGGVVDFTTSSNVTLGSVGNLHISGGTSGYVLQTDGTGILSWVAQTGGGGGGTPGGNTTELQFNNAGSFAGIANVTYASGNLTLGPVANVKITGGSSNLFVRTDGAGNLSFQAITSNLTVGTRSTAVNIGISNYQMNVAARTGNVTVNVN